MQDAVVLQCKLLYITNGSRIQPTLKKVSLHPRSAVKKVKVIQCLGKEQFFRSGRRLNFHRLADNMLEERLNSILSQSYCQLDTDKAGTANKEQREHEFHVQQQSTCDTSHAHCMHRLITSCTKVQRSHAANYEQKYYYKTNYSQFQDFYKIAIDQTNLNLDSMITWVNSTVVIIAIATCLDEALRSKLRQPVYKHTF